MSNPAFFFIPFLVDFALSGAGIVINFHAQDLGATPSDLGYLGSSWGISYMISCLIVGRLADRICRKKLMCSGLGILTVLVWSFQWMQSPGQLIVMNFLLGAACALFWPVFETLLHSSDKIEGNRRIGLFNIGWTLGIGCGAATGGYLSQWGAVRGLNSLTCVTLLALVCLLVATRRGIPAAENLPEESECGDADAAQMSSAERLTFLHIAWIANFTLWFAAGCVNSLFPKLCRTLFIPDHTGGLLLGLIMAGQALSFYLISKTTSWHYRLAPMIGFQILATAGCVMLAWGGSPAGFALAMLFMGLGRGLTYCCSLYYGLAAESGRGANAGIHEMLIGFASAFGPLLGGVTAQLLDLRAPFYMCTFIGLVGVAVEVALWRRMHRSCARAVVSQGTES